MNLMLKRVIAWILIIGFLFIVADVIFIGFHRTLFIAVYAAIIVFYIFTNKKA